MAMLLKKVLGLGSTRSNPNPRQQQALDSQSQHMMVLGVESAARGSSAAMGAFDRIPDEIFFLILKLLGAKEAARNSVVCRTWRALVSDNRLWIHFLQSDDQLEPWDSIFFAETRLRSGYPLQVYYSQEPQLSFMRIYGQRAQVPGSVIIDGGSGYCKFGWSKYRGPSGRSATFYEFGNIESPMYSRLSRFYTTIYGRMQVKPPNQPIVVSIPICHYDDTESAKASRRQLREAIHSVLFDLNVPAVCAINQATLALYAARKTSGIVVNVGFQQTSIVPKCSNRRIFLQPMPRSCDFGQLASTSFIHGGRVMGYTKARPVNMKIAKKLLWVSLFYNANLAFTLARLKEEGRTRCFRILTAQVLHGKVMCKVGVESVGMGALKLTEFLREQLQQKNIYFESLYIIRELKEKMCYVAFDYKSELSKNTQASYEISREGVFTLSEERFQTGEILFQPRMAGVDLDFFKLFSWIDENVSMGFERSLKSSETQQRLALLTEMKFNRRAMGLHQAVALCMDHCRDAELMCDESWFKTVVLSGGTACLPGLAERLEKELYEILPPSMASGIRVIPPPNGADSAWFGAKVISNLSTFPGAWCVTKKQFKHKFKRNLTGLR